MRDCRAIKTPENAERISKLKTLSVLLMVSPSYFNLPKLMKEGF